MPHDPSFTTHGAPQWHCFGGEHKASRCDAGVLALWPAVGTESKSEAVAKSMTMKRVTLYVTKLISIYNIYIHINIY